MKRINLEIRRFISDSMLVTDLSTYLSERSVRNLALFAYNRSSYHV